MVLGEKKKNQEAGFAERKKMRERHERVLGEFDVF